MHAIEENPIEAVPREQQDTVQFRTGDPVVDKWERQIAGGGAVDLMESFLPEDREKVLRFLNRKKVEETPPEGFSDQYKEP